MKRRVFILILGIAAGVGGWKWSRRAPEEPKKGDIAPPAQSAELVTVPRVERAVPKAPDTTRPAESPVAMAATTRGDASGPPPVQVVPGPTAWDREMEAVMTGEREPAARAGRLFAMLPRLPVEAFAEVTEKAVDQLPDDAYGSTALPIITKATTPAPILSVMFADLMERPDAITLPALLSIARDARHPFGPSALDNLKLLLRADHGRDWAAWQQAIDRNPARAR